MGIIAFIILGAIAGAIAKALLPGDDPGGFIITTIIGIVGAIIGGFLAAALFDADPLDEFFDISTLADGDRRRDRPAAGLPRRRRQDGRGRRLRQAALSGPSGSMRAEHPLLRMLSLREGEGLTAARERAHGREPPAVLAPDVGEDAQRRGLDLVDVEAAGLAAAVRPRLAEAGRDRDDDRVLAVRASRARTRAARRSCSGGCARRARGRRPPRRARRGRGSASRPASSASATARRAGGGGARRCGTRRRAPARTLGRTRGPARREGGRTGGATAGPS